jgi:hypothetical protein
LERGKKRLGDVKLGYERKKERENEPKREKDSQKNDINREKSQRERFEKNERKSEIKGVTKSEEMIQDS